MKLTDLQAELIRYDTSGPQYGPVLVETIEEAQGVRFRCPKCAERNGSQVGVHWITCWSRSRGVKDKVRPGPGRWRMEGTGLANLSLFAEIEGGARSVQMEGCGWHGYVTAGQVADA